MNRCFLPGRAPRRPALLASVGPQPHPAQCLLVGLLSILAVAAGCSQAESPKGLEIGALYPTSGPQSPGGTEEERGARLAVEWANGHGGVGGEQVRMRTADTPRAESVPSAMRAFREDGVTLVVGSHGSPISAAAAQEASDRNMSFWETGAVGEVGPEVAGGSRFFRLAPMGANLGQVGVSFVRDQLVPQLTVRTDLRYAVAFVDDAYGRAVGEGAAEEVRRSGRTLAGVFPYDLRRADFAALAADIGAIRADVLFVSAYLDDAVALRRALLDARVPLLASIGTSSSYCMPMFGERMGDGAVGLFASDKPDAADVRREALSAEGRGALEWVETRYRDRYGEAMGAAALSGFSNAYALLVHVLPAAATMRPDDIAAAALRVKLPEGTLANGAGLDIAAPGSADAGANRAAASVIWEWVAPRTRAVVCPPAYATHPIVALPISP